jgi:beta-N-acetylhexosaminidase
MPRVFLPFVSIGIAIVPAAVLAIRAGVGSSHPSGATAGAEQGVAVADHANAARVGGSGAARRRRARSAARDAGLARALGETIVTRMSGTAPSATLLANIRAGRLGGVILFTESFADGSAAAARAIGHLQSAARAAGTWPLLIMTDQEGGEVRRLAKAPPHLAPRSMSSTQVAYAEGLATGRALEGVGVNVDLAPVADVEQVAGSFLGTRSFGASPVLVGERACAFARGLSAAGIDYTLKHFPGLGTATSSTDAGPVSVDTSATTLRANYAPYRRCGHGPRALVMISSASYPALSGGEAPAVDSRETYRMELARAGVDAVTISDDMQTDALAGLERPAARALAAGLDLLLYAQSEQVASAAYEKLDAELRGGELSAARVREAADQITRLKAGVAR